MARVRRRVSRKRKSYSKRRASKTLVTATATIRRGKSSLVSKHKRSTKRRYGKKRRSGKRKSKK